MLRLHRHARSALLTLALTGSAARTQTPPSPTPSAQEAVRSRLQSLDLPQADTDQLSRLLAQHDFLSAEKLLLPAIEHQPPSPHTAKLLAFLGAVYFSNGDFWNAAVAWNKSDALTPLDPSLRFSLAMAYVHLGRPDWARKALRTLEAADPRQALYPYWLGRLDYDAHRYPDAIEHLQHAIALDPNAPRAHDSLGLCFFYLNQNVLAVEQFHQAIELDRASPHPSPWPFLNLAIALQFTDHLDEAAANLDKALALDPKLPQAHFERGNVLEHQSHPEQAVAEFALAAQLDPTYAEPHVALARLYRKLGRSADSQAEVERYKRLHIPSAAGEPVATGTLP